MKDFIAESRLAGGRSFTLGDPDSFISRTTGSTFKAEFDVTFSAEGSRLKYGAFDSVPYHVHFSTGDGGKTYHVATNHASKSRLKRDITPIIKSIDPKAKIRDVKS